MPGPPPPPPPGVPPPMMPPPPTAFAPSKGGPDNRSALLSSIRQGAKLKKTVTVDKSAPMLGKNSNGNSGGIASPSSRGGNGSTMGGVGGGPPMGLGGLFAGGMPKLKPTGKQLAPSNANRSTDGGGSPTASKNFSSIQTELRKQMANDSKNRGPPPPAPVRNFNNDDITTSSRQPSTTRNGFHQNLNTAVQNNAHHRKTQSNVNVTTTTTTMTADATDSSSQNNNVAPPKPSINHGKPNLAPKPPSLNGKPAAPPKKLSLNGKPISRAQSMRSPRSPSPHSPDNNNPEYQNKFGTVRNLSSVLNQNHLGHSLGNLTQMKPRTPLNGRPTAPPPSVPGQQVPPPPPPSKTVRPPNHAPPPPPNAIPQAPSHAPPPPPHRTQAPSRAPPAIPTAMGGLSAPPPPPRNSSIRDVGGNMSRRPSNAISVSSSSCSITTNNTSSLVSELEKRFAFHSPSEFPKPMPFRNVHKVYNGRQESKC
ncbi:PREDICTED: WAS/WASL-interacting protein family member 1-like isoform X2 [Nicrophorus vespilloides]|uniref:WAS/WASL-interacting protein family member 1-like isoform X2 n=1 Tax=Nicrophorus vespilloides TaxID=110193 RepID=A0ABM1MF49_NICVS|nr:PREDICTED: WAS/WASL-interacting protein family member 1-like isoform X2 [Nicrophorus vespilloides]